MCTQTPKDPVCIYIKNVVAISVEIHFSSITITRDTVARVKYSYLTA